MNPIKFVYFDVGGVLLLDFSKTDKWSQLKRDLGVSSEKEPFFDAVWQKYRNRICIDCDVDTIAAELVEAAGCTLPEEYSMLADFVNRFEQNPSIWPVAHAVKQQYKVGLLTNMYPRMLALIKENQLIPDIEWDAVVDSSSVGYQKPDREIFEIAQARANVNPHAILFIDNSEEHVTVAKNLGWQAIVYDSDNIVCSTQTLLLSLFAT